MTGNVPPADRIASPKIQAWHLDRLAVVYVRQSTPHQVAENRESADRQYALRGRAVEFGWPADRVLVIDDDQGRSGTTADGRPGFRRLLAEVGLDHVGIVFGLEMSRLARSCKDWHQLVELCGLFRTLLADQDGVYDPTDPNDRMLLGLRGIMSEAEVHVLRGRMRQGLLNKVRRGEVFLGPPVGYVRAPGGGFDLDPDEQARGAVRLVFDQFDRVGTALGVLRYLRAHGVRVGIRPHAGPNRGQLEWRPPTQATVLKILRHPVYAGYYCYGRKQTDPRRKAAGRRFSGRVVVPPEAYRALIPDVCPAYISRDRYEANQRRLADNRARTASKGAPRAGPSLLAGLVACGRCGRRMAVRYSGPAQTLRYECVTGRAGDRPACRHAVAGRVVDRVVADLVLAALRPGALELSLAAADDVLRERAALDEQWRRRVERARLEAGRAERQFQAAEPENRLVARTLEGRWEDALRAARDLAEEYARFRGIRPATLTRREADEIRALAADLPALWDAATTGPADRQQVIRFLVERVEVAVEGDTDRVRVAVTWVGGQRTEHAATRPVARYSQAADFDRVLARTRELRAAGQTFAAVADRLNAEGFRPPKGAGRFHKNIVSRIVRRYTPGYRPPPKADRSALGAGEWFVVDLAREVGVGKTTLHAWRARGWVSYRRPAGPRTPCVCWADAGEVARLRRLAGSPRGCCDPPLPPDLTTPAPPPGQYRKT